MGGFRKNRSTQRQERERVCVCVYLRINCFDITKWSHNFKCLEEFSEIKTNVILHLLPSIVQFILHMSWWQTLFILFLFFLVLHHLIVVWKHGNILRFIHFEIPFLLGKSPWDSWWSECEFKRKLNYFR